jgi:hypothetical protein
MAQPVSNPHSAVGQRHDRAAAAQTDRSGGLEMVPTDG